MTYQQFWALTPTQRKELLRQNPNYSAHVSANTEGQQHK